MPIPLILSHSGVELAGMLAEPLQEHIVMTAGDSIRLTQATAGKGVSPLTH